MQRYGPRLLLSATDLVTFHECEHATALDRAALDDAALRELRSEADATAALLQRKGHQFEARYLQQLRVVHPGLVEIQRQGRQPPALAAATLDAMRCGAPVIYQATLLDGDLVGHADFLRRVERPSQLGAYSYEVIDTKLARSPKAKFVLQLAFYGELLAKAQGIAPQFMHVVLGSLEEVSYRCDDYSRYFRRLLDRFRSSLRRSPGASYPSPCERCATCGWQQRCADKRATDDSLWLVAGMRSSQVQKLEAAGIRTLARLASLPAEHNVPGLVAETLVRLREQAAVQLRGRVAGKVVHELVTARPDGDAHGLERLPAPDAGDVFFDMEGDPLVEGGLEYLFGVLYRRGTKWQFKAFWGHDRSGEREAFEQFMDWLAARMRKHPTLHVYHYAAYEDSALKRLSGRHGTREAFLDQLLRERRLVDLYRVVRESIRASTPSYSLKDLEKFYREARHGEVQDAGASIVSYERYLETGDTRLLEDIERYNEDDVRSLQQLHDWLLQQRPRDLPWCGVESSGDVAADVTAGNEPSAKLQAYLEAVAGVRKPLLAGLPADATQWTPTDRAKALLADLLEFHRRNEKPQWWEMFARREHTFDELLDSLDALAGLQRVAGGVGEYEYPPQEARFKAGEYVKWLEHPEQASVGIVEIDAERRRVRLKSSRRSGPLPERLSIGAAGPISTTPLKEALLRVGTSFVAGDHRYRALEAYCQKRPPRLRRHRVGAPLVADPAAPLPDIIDAVARMNDTYLFIQGPPGAGKTYTGSHVIVELLAQGKRVAVAANSHKAINNLLAAVEKVLQERGMTDVMAAKKSSSRDADSYLDGSLIVDVDDNESALSGRWQLVGGTAWLLAGAQADQQFDYLFIDEAGQVSVANLVAMGACARNLVLLGDQMQLGQPIQGDHPGRSGESSLEYLLDGRATVPPDLGIFLPVTWRMCPEVCRFISESIYDGRLEPAPGNANQRLVLRTRHHPALRPTGVVFLAVDHAGCAQRSVEEADEILRIYTSLLGQSWIDRKGRKHRVTPDDILVVAPYNLQVNLLQRTLPEGARVGTVDKFQGQEAAVTLISMTTSSDADLPRHIDFLFSKNRLNVAISRARCLSIVLANPRLLDTRCKTPEQIGLVNLLCWASETGS